MLAHTVYFTLKDNSAENTLKLVSACQKYLSDHAGTIFYGAGTRGEEFQRDVNVQDYDVALVIVFTGKEAHDAYQVSEKHQAFIAENRDNWKSVCVYDSYVSRD